MSQERCAADLSRARQRKSERGSSVAGSQQAIPIISARHLCRISRRGAVWPRPEYSERGESKAPLWQFLSRESCGCDALQFLSQPGRFGSAQLADGPNTYQLIYSRGPDAQWRRAEAIRTRGSL